VAALRSWHKWLGWVLVTQLILWAVTGAIFILKPGYGPAYETPKIQFLPVSARDLQRVASISNTDWQGLRILKTSVGEHLLVDTAEGVKHLNFIGEEQAPSLSVVKHLLRESIGYNPGRYGELKSIEGLVGITSTGVELTLNWQQLSIRQQGADSRLINLLYKLHYLQFTDNAFVNKTLATLALLLLVALSVFGVVISLSRK
jgi:hypothetical protein